MSRRKKLIHRRAIPLSQIAAIARWLLPAILAFYESEEGQREFAEWNQRREVEGQEDNRG